MSNFSSNGNTTEFTTIRIIKKKKKHILAMDDGSGNLLVLKNKLLKQRQRMKRGKKKRGSNEASFCFDVKATMKLQTTAHNQATHKPFPGKSSWEKTLMFFINTVSAQ